jgi:hypothetical protein
MTTETASTPLESVFVAGRYIGCLLSRGSQGVEVYDDKQRSLGTFQSKARALAVLQAGGEDPCADC